MNKLLLSFAFFTSLIFNQERFLNQIFDNINITNDVVYANAPDLPLLFLTENAARNVDLKMDIYQPTDDTYKNRPLIIFSHSGGFFSGSKDADDMRMLCEIAAKKGYVAVSMNYRLGFNVLSQDSVERAVYRAIQDGSAIIRYFREYADYYNIDQNQIFWWGSSAGSFIGLHLTYVEEDERLESTYGSNFSPDLGCISCSGNKFNHNDKPNAVISTWGAIGDLNLIDKNENTPIALFHGTKDIIVPYYKGFPYTLNTVLSEVYGSALISERLNELSIDHLLVLEEGKPHEYYGTANGNFIFGSKPNEYWDLLVNDSFEFLYKHLIIN